MARMYSRKKGKSGSTKPITPTKKTWVRYKPKEIEKLVVKIAKTGNTASQIGLELRDVYGVPDVKGLTGKKINKILEENKLKQGLPDDLTFLIKKHIKLMKHMNINKKDMVSKRGIQLTDSKIRRLVKYYKRTKRLPADWKYDPKKAKLLIS